VSTVDDRSLQAALDEAGSPVELLRNSPARPTVFPVAPEFTNWRSEQRAWRESCALFDQSHHMTDLFVSGPDATRLFRDLAVNTFAGFPVDRAKQFVAVNEDGRLIGDAILFHLDADAYDLVGHPMAIDWVQFHAESAGYDVVLERDDNSIVRRGAPKLFRFELQGPTALAVVEKLIGGPVPEVRFFGMAPLAFGDVELRALRHGMAGQPGFELFGPWADGERVREALLAAGDAFDLVPVGAKGYSTANLESGWVPSPVPAIFTGEATAAYRRWLPAARAGSLGGSFRSDDIADYCLTPWDLGYDRLIAFDHDFVGRDALERLADAPHRTKVTLVWNPDDLAAAVGTLFRPGDKAKHIELPKARYALYQCDAVLADGSLAGMSHDCGYIANENAFVSLASVDENYAAPGAEVTVLWGESPPSSKPQVEAHVQVELRATVAPAPYVEFARGAYRAG
jgi:glycine cleavage system aminomethyltransferase T